MKRALACAVALVAATSASAADLPRRGAPSYVAPPMFTWTGFYLGLNAGAAWGSFTKSARDVNSHTGFTGGFTAGYNHQFGNMVVGVEGDYNLAGVRGRGLVVPGPAFVRGEMTSFGTIRGRLGMAFDRALVYGTAGYAFGNTKLDSGLFTRETTQHGYAIGGGLEYAFTNNVSAKAEYLYVPLDSKNAAAAVGVLPGAKAGFNANILRAGVNYRF